MLLYFCYLCDFTQELKHAIQRLFNINPLVLPRFGLREKTQIWVDANFTLKSHLNLWPSSWEMTSPTSRHSANRVHIVINESKEDAVKFYCVTHSPAGSRHSFSFTFLKYFFSAAGGIKGPSTLSSSDLNNKVTFPLNQCVTSFRECCSSLPWR